MNRPSLLNAKYVLFREDTQTHEEIYFKDIRGIGVEHTSDLDEAAGFATAREAYHFGGLAGSRLEWWKVGLRS